MFLCLNPVHGEDFVDPATGKFVCKYTLSAAKINSPAAPAGLIITLHPNGGSDGPMVSYTRSMLKKAGIGQDFTVLGVKSIGPSWTKSFDYGKNKDLQNIIRLIEFLGDNMPVDKRRIFVWGFSAGGMTAALLGSKKPGYFHSTASFGGYGFDVPKVKNPWENAPLFFSSSENKDPNLGFIQRAIPKQEKAGLHWISHEVNGMGHKMSTTQSDLLLQSFLSLAVQRRKNSIQISEEDRQKLAMIQQKLGSDSKGLSRGDAADLARLGGATAAPLVLKMLKSSHAPLQKQGIELAASGAHDSSVRAYMVDLARNEADKKLSSAAITLLESLAEWRYPQAEKGLSDLLVDDSLSEKHRSLVIQAVADALRFGAFGPRRDHKVMWAALEKAAAGDDKIAQYAQRFLSKIPAKP